MLKNKKYILIQDLELNHGSFGKASSIDDYIRVELERVVKEGTVLEFLFETKDFADKPFWYVYIPEIHVTYRTREYYFLKKNQAFHY